MWARFPWAGRAWAGGGRSLIATATVTATATATLGLVTVDVTWSGATYLNVVRVHADGTVYPVRTAYPATASTTGGTTTVYDYEAPLDSPVSYLVMVPGSRLRATSNTVTLASNGNTWLGHPDLPALNRVVLVREQPERLRPISQGVFSVIGRARPVVVTSGVRQASSGELLIRAFTSADRDGVLALIADGSPLLLRTPPGYGWDPLTWLAVGDVKEQPVSDKGARPGRVFVLPFLEVDGPAVGAA